MGYTPNQVAEWVKPHHRLPFCLVTSLYDEKPIQTLEGYTWIDGLHESARMGAWINSSGECIIGCRGTQPALWGNGLKDLIDDSIIAGLTRASAADMSLVQEADAVVKQLVEWGVPYAKMMIGGHSLGGFTAMNIATKYKLHVCSFNGAAPLTKPLLTGPGPTLATHYHIVGDLISTHMSPNAADVIRMNKKAAFAFILPHNTERFLAKDPTYGAFSADDEEAEYLSFGTTFALTYARIEPLTAATVFYLTRSSPIPGSKEFGNIPTVEDIGAEFEKHVPGGYNPILNAVGQAFPDPNRTWGGEIPVEKNLPKTDFKAVKTAGAGDISSSTEIISNTSITTAYQIAADPTLNMIDKTFGDHKWGDRNPTILATDRAFGKDSWNQQLLNQFRDDKVKKDDVSYK